LRNKTLYGLPTILEVILIFKAQTVGEEAENTVFLSLEKGK